MGLQAGARSGAPHADTALNMSRVAARVAGGAGGGAVPSLRGRRGPVPAPALSGAATPTEIKVLQTTGKPQRTQFNRLRPEARDGGRAAGLGAEGSGIRGRGGFSLSILSSNLREWALFS